MADFFFGFRGFLFEIQDQVVAALQKAGHSFDFVPIINAGHGAAETPYGKYRRAEFLVKHLRP